MFLDELTKYAQGVPKKASVGDGHIFPEEAFFGHLVYCCCVYLLFNAFGERI